MSQCDPKKLDDGVRCLGDSLDTPSHHRHVRDVVKEREIKAVGITPETELMPSLGSTDADIAVLESRTAALFALVDEARRIADDVFDPDRNAKIDALREQYRREHAALCDYVRTLDAVEDFLPEGHPLKS